MRLLTLPVLRTLVRAAACGACWALATAGAAPTDIASEPVITIQTVSAKPNLMFILDNSGSMAWDFMPDDMGANGTGLTGSYGYWSAQCNGVAYDPAYSYTPPIRADGSAFPNASFAAAWDDGYAAGATVNLGATSSASYSSTTANTTSTGSKSFVLSGSGYSGTTFGAGDAVTITSSFLGLFTARLVGTVTGWVRAGGSNWTLTVTIASASGNLPSASNWTIAQSTSSNFYYVYGGSQTAMNWTYTPSDGAADDSTTFYRECMSDIASSPGSAVFTRVRTTDLTDAQKQNYANWYSYHRKRYLLMRTAVGKAFGTLDAGYRVGFSTIGDTGVTDGTNYFRDARDFDATQRANFYSSLYSAPPSGGTPLRVALSKVGRYFARQVSGQTYDPMQYSCQRNFAMLSTDGYWNSGFGYRLDGSTKVGNQDAAEARPVYEGAVASADTLADVAQYYYNTDLRNAVLGNCSSSASGTSRDVCTNNVPTSTRDPATTQHMATFTIGLGVGGTLAYDPNYLAQTTGDYAAIARGSKDWPIPANTQTTSGSSGDARNVDDLWHAAVNGRGQYYSARSASALGSAISGVVTSVQEVTGAGSSAAATSPQLVSGSGNQLFQSSYRTVSWTGDVQAFSIDGATGTIGGSAQWSAQAMLAGRTPAGRAIYYRQPSGASALRSFTAANLATDGYGGYFSGFCAQATVPAQCSGLSADNRTLANTGANLVDYLRGVRTYEAGNAASPLYRTRAAVLGDIIGGAPVYMAASPFAYADAGYAAFKAGTASRAPVVYAAANDGMLHAFNAGTGAELWAYVPTAVMPRLYRLADTSYSTSHQYSVDGAPVIGDVFVGGSWKTILVGGLNAGGRAYYALDITDPANPRSLWEFTDANLGLSYGNPVITKRADGSWVVVFASGYNNTGGDGRGHLFVVDAGSGARLLDIATTAGSSGSPSGLARINAWVDDVADNTSLRFYGGDLLGNLWRFDIDNRVQPHQAALLLAQFQTASGQPQPVTTQPLTAQVSSLYPVVAVGTGRYLGTSDIADTTPQSIYAVKDPLTATGWGVVRNNTSMVRQTITVSGTGSTVTSTAVNWASNNGWWTDLPLSGERIVTDMLLQSGTLVAASAVPSGDSCTSGGSSWLYQFNFTTGSSTTVVGQQLSTTTLAVGLAAVRRSNGSVGVIVTDSQGNRRTYNLDGLSTGIGTPRRSAWRELVD